MKSGFVRSPLGLRRKILLVMQRSYLVTADQIAAAAYARRICFDGRTNRCSTAELVAVRRALRRLADRGHVAHVGWRRRRKVWSKL